MDGKVTNKIVYKVSDFMPAYSVVEIFDEEDIFIIEVIDEDQKPIAGLEFNVEIDGGDVKTKVTDKNGILKVNPKPQSEVNISLTVD